CARVSDAAVEVTALDLW
nr:immunoglobulin heavy chain junction region [Macaca mulatta]MOX91864.1 immunoglobulin heavy chain junction region [Macaca mulatta]MOX92094.1 immunoglobulin heavy chain junction region [Macaca mulatta]MOX92112.1 immunoglobulin heavy chain junction region [Macaca mulatta]MOX92295.1 immunoglobulin heavy chain junction region [Macaca mulatta]